MISDLIDFKVLFISMNVFIAYNYITKKDDKILLKNNY